MNAPRFFTATASTLASLTLLVASGCGGSGPDIVEVSGQLTRGGKPVPNLTVMFQPDEGRPSWGRSDENGNFTLSYDPERDGARIGMHTVVVRYKAQSMDEETGKVKVVHHPEEQAIIQKYGGAGAEPLRIEIKEETDNLEIKLD
jgi:hypothetical protein